MIGIKEVENIQILPWLWVKPEYLNHENIGGNKIRKLKYNLLEAKKQSKRTLLTFGGAFSNHILAVSMAGALYDFETIGIIRGEELARKTELNPTLAEARKNGMKLEFVSREVYRRKDSVEFLDDLKGKYGDYYLIPEGGTNKLAIKGCEEILGAADAVFNIVCCPVGTGGSIAGIINSSRPPQNVFGFSALKGDFLTNSIRKFTDKSNWQLITKYHFGGYGKINTELISFINRFKSDYNITLDPLYTGKMMYGIFDMKKKDLLPPNAKILAIHTGGLQGIKGMNQKLKSKGKDLLIE